jgi:outer membrane immunogenic protein
MKRFALGSIGVIGLLFADQANAADLPVGPAVVPAVPYVAPDLYVPWSGLYIGVHGGVRSNQWSFTEFDKATTPPTVLETDAFRSTGVILGPQMGANLALHQLFLIGVEGDVSAQFLNTTFTATQTPPAANGLPSRGPVQVSHHFTMPWFATGRVRAGAIFANTLIYATGGAALADATVQRTSTIVTNVPLTETAISANAWGWTAGGGVEWAFTNSLSAKCEYLHVWLGQGPGGGTTFNFPVSQTSLHSRLNIDTLRLGLNWKFLGSDW